MFAILASINLWGDDSSFHPWIDISSKILLTTLRNCSMLTWTKRSVIHFSRTGALTLPDLSIIIVTYNHESEIKRCLLTLKNALASLHAEIFIIDNHSSDATISVIKHIQTNFDEQHNWSIICNDTNIGFTKAVNQGLAQIQGTYVLILNPDTELPQNIFQPFVTTSQLSSSFRFWYDM